MRFFTKILMALVGFAFTFGGVGKVEAQEAKLAKNGTVVLARENYRPTKSVSSLEELRNSVTVLASEVALHVRMISLPNAGSAVRAAIGISTFSKDWCLASPRENAASFAPRGTAASAAAKVLPV